MKCLERISSLYGTKTPIRIGGTTGYRATYDPEFDGYVSYSVANPLDAPDTLTYGPQFWDLKCRFLQSNPYERVSGLIFSSRNSFIQW